jgi:D-serine deaminase-like pyridoxal phosphate-dependent protein
VALVPAHVCTCVNLSDELVCHRGGEVQAVWPVVARGKRT